MKRRYGILLSMAGLMLLLSNAGCGGGGGGEQYDVVPVSGVVTCEGKPVANAGVNFTPIAEEGRAEGRPGRPALAITDEQGRFRLSTYGDYDGAIVGSHRVTVGLDSQSEDGQSDPNKGFPCRNSSQEVLVFKGMEEIQIDF